MLVLDDGSTRLAVVSMDLKWFRQENTTNIKKTVKEKTGIENVLCAATHSHAAQPRGGDGYSEEGPWIREVENKIAGAIVEAAGSLAPARIGSFIRS